jgi:hypothetical protein
LIYIGYGNWKILALLYYIVVITILVQKLISLNFTHYSYEFTNSVYPSRSYCSSTTAPSLLTERYYSSHSYGGSDSDSDSDSDRTPSPFNFIPSRLKINSMVSDLNF